MPANKEPKKRKVQRINLLPKEEFEASIVGRVLHWAVSTFRVIVIFTEIVVMAAFMSRFWFDAQDSDLNDEITQKKEIINAYNNIEQEFRAAQTGIETYRVYTQDGIAASEIINNVSQRLPSDTWLASYTVVDKQIKLRALTTSESSISQLITNLGSSGLFSQVNIDQIETSSTEPFITFIVSANL